MATTGDPARSTAAALVSDARRRRGMSQRELARAARVPQSTVAMIESDRRQPSMAMVERLLDAAGFRLDTRLTNNVRPSELLKRYGSAVATVLQLYPITRVWVFGSVARGDDNADSDLDLLVELEPDTTVVDIIGLDEDLSAVLGCPVDVVTTTEADSNELFQRSVSRQRRELHLVA